MATPPTRKGTAMAMPHDYPMKENGGKAIISRDFFPTMCPSQLNDDWATKTIKFRPWFEKSAVDQITKIVRADHETAENNKEGRVSWLEKVQKEIFGKQYKATMTMGWNIGLAELTNSDSNNAMEAKKSHGVDFSFQKKRPTTQGDVKSILFGDTVTNMIKNGNLEEPMALLFKWGYYLTMEGCSVRWTERATEKYISDKGYNIELGNDCVMEKQMSVHCLNRIGRKIAINSFQTQLRRKQEKIWGVKLLTSTLLETPATKDMETVDIKEFLPKEVKDDMTRKDGTVFRIMRYTPTMVDDTIRLSSRVDDLMRWAKDGDLEGAMVRSVFNKSLDKYFNNKTPGKEKEDEDNSMDNEEFATEAVESEEQEQKKAFNTQQGKGGGENITTKEKATAKRVVAKKKNTPRSGTTMAKQRDQIPESVAAETKKKLDEYLALETNEVRLSLILK